MRPIPSARLAAGVLLVFAGLASADSITPATFSTTLAVGGTATINKTVSITQQLTAPLDVFFLSDTTGSMAPTISGIQTGFSNVVTSLAGVAANSAFGVGEYKDVVDPFVYRLNQAITTNTAAAQAGFGAWSAGGGGDLPEANLYGLQQAALTAGWRTGSQRFLVWVGDAPGHDPRNGSTEASAIAALRAAGITVFAASATSGPGLNAACDTGDCTAGQANRITAATGGSFLGNFAAGAITTAITNALITTVTNYSTVSLQVMGAPAGVSVTLPAAITGTFDRSINRNFNFNGVTFTGLAAGTYTFSINALVDGRVVATETDTITVGAPGIPEPASLVLIGTGLAAVGLLRRRFC